MQQQQQDVSAFWACIHCTFLNHAARTDCEVCTGAKPRGALATVSAGMSFNQNVTTTTASSTGAPCTRILVETLDLGERTGLRGQIVALPVTPSTTVGAIKRLLTEHKEFAAPGARALFDHLHLGVEREIVHRRDNNRLHMERQLLGDDAKTLEHYRVPHDATIKLLAPPKAAFAHAVISVSATELAATSALLDFEWPRDSGLSPASSADTNTYTFGVLGGVNVVLACLPAGAEGQTSGALVVTNASRSFPSIKSVVLTSVAGAIPNPTEPDRDAYLGDVVFSCGDDVVEPSMTHLRDKGTFAVARSSIGRPDLAMVGASILLARDPNLSRRLADTAAQVAARMYSSESKAAFCRHVDPHAADVLRDETTGAEIKSERGRREQRVLAGGVASTPVRITSARLRDDLRQGYNARCAQFKAGSRATVLCADTTSAGVAVSELNITVVCGMADYCDKFAGQSKWRGFAAASAAAYMRLLFETLSRSTRELGAADRIPHPLAYSTGTSADAKGDFKSGAAGAAGATSTSSSTISCRTHHAPQRAMCTKTIRADLFSIAVISSLPIELDAIVGAFDAYFGTGWLPTKDHIVLKLGRIGQHMVLAASSTDGIYGTASLAMVTTEVVRSFPHIQNLATVGVASALTTGKDDNYKYRLGDVIVATGEGIVEHDLGELKLAADGMTVQGDIKKASHLSPPGHFWMAALSQYEANNLLHPPRLVPVAKQIIANLSPGGRVKTPFVYARPRPQGDQSDADVLYEFGARKGIDDFKETKVDRFPRLNARQEPDPTQQQEHSGTVLCGRTQLDRSSRVRDWLHARTRAICLDPAAAGLVSTQKSYLLVRGLWSYGDAHSDPAWQGYAAAHAAASFKNVLLARSGAPGRSSRFRGDDNDDEASNKQNADRLALVSVIAEPDIAELGQQGVADYKMAAPPSAGRSDGRSDGRSGVVSPTDPDARRKELDLKRKAQLDARFPDPSAKKARGSSSPPREFKQVSAGEPVWMPSGPGGPQRLEQEIQRVRSKQGKEDKDTEAQLADIARHFLQAAAFGVGSRATAAGEDFSDFACLVRQAHEMQHAFSTASGAASAVSSKPDA